MGKKSTPTPPDYEAAAERTAEGNLENLDAQTLANRPNMYTPMGSSEWTKDPQTGQWTNNVALDPASQQAIDDQQGITAARSGTASNMLGNIDQDFSNPMNWDQFGEFSNTLSNGADARQAATDASYGQATSRLDPRFDQRRQEQDAQLRAQGLRPGDEAYDKSMGNLGRESNDAYNNAMFSSILTGGQEGQRDQSMDLTSNTFGNEVRQADIAEEMQRRGFSLNELNALLNGQQIGLPGFQGFSQAGYTGGADYTGAAQDTYSGQMDQYNAKQAQQQMLMGAATSAMSFSDIRLKRNVQFAGVANGRRWYSWDWITGGSDYGIIAQENPDVAVPHSSGYLMINYGEL